MPESQPTTNAEQLLGAEILQNSTRHFENIFLAKNPLAAKRLSSGDGFVFLDGLVRLLFQPTGGAGRTNHAGCTTNPHAAQAWQEGRDQPVEPLSARQQLTLVAQGLGSGVRRAKGRSQPCHFPAQP